MKDIDLSITEVTRGVYVHAFYVSNRGSTVKERKVQHTFPGLSFRFTFGIPDLLMMMRSRDYC